MVRFGDTVRIHAWIKEYNGIRMTIGYEMRDASSGELRTPGGERPLLPHTGRPSRILKAVLSGMG